MAWSSGKAPTSYDGLVLCDLRILRVPIRYGTHDEEDPPELAEDREGEFYRVEYGSTTECDSYRLRSQTVESLEEAVRVAEESPGIGETVRWFD